MIVNQSRPARHHFNARIHQQILVNAVQSRDLFGTIGLEHIPVKAWRISAPAEPLPLVKRFGKMGGVAVKLFWNAAHVHTRTAERACLRERNARATLRSHA